MSTINISLPTKLKTQADALIKAGYYVSFSDLVRTALRYIIQPTDADEYVSPRALRRYDTMAKDIDSGKEPVYGATSVKDLMDQLDGRKPPVRIRVPKTL